MDGPTLWSLPDTSTPPSTRCPVSPQFREPMLLFRNSGKLTFDDVSDTSGLNDEPLQSRRGIAFGDLNNDGNIDAVVFNAGEPPSILINDSKNSNHRVMFRLVGTTSNKAAIGARVTITADGVTQIREVKGGSSYISQSDLRLHFGLGEKTTKIAKVVIRWPNGNIEELKDVAADAIYTVVEGSGIKGRRRCRVGHGVPARNSRYFFFGTILSRSTMPLPSSTE